MSPAIGAIKASPTEVSFGTLNGVSVDSSTPDVYKLTGSTSDLEAALDSLTLAPGKNPARFPACSFFFVEEQCRWHVSSLFCCYGQI